MAGYVFQRLGPGLRSNMAAGGGLVHAPEGGAGGGAADALAPFPPLLRKDGSPLCILQLVPALEQGGVERGALDIARAIVAAGGRALVASRGGRMEARLDRAGGELVRLDIGAKSPLSIWRNARALAKLAAAEGVDVIHARSRAPAWAGLRAAQAAGIPFVTTYHGVHSEGFPGKRFYNSVMARGKPVIAVSEHVAAMIRERHPFAKDIRVIHRGSDLAAFDPDAVSRERIEGLALRWGLVEDPRPVIALPGRLTRWKGQEEFIEAARILREMRGAEDFLCLMIGGDETGPYAAELSRAIADAGLENVARLAGSVDDMPAALKLSAVVVSASNKPEAFGRVATEGMAMKRPVIATDHGGAQETVADGDTGWLIPPGDAGALAGAMQKALSLTEAEAAAMGAAGRARVASMFSLQGMQEAVLGVYREVTRGR
ncbi:glycosyltransferase family 4 protein [Rhodovulum sp. DZ06]|uniref:glycosyltransferase family 4 protein n=1 Tax=Rhodovulum sp. DZ06 TaxID=3425126 RepID=UPI003D33CF4C